MSKDKNAPIIILEASKQPFLSIGTIYGAINTYGQDYTYIKSEDVFLRNDYLKEYKKFKKWDDFIETIKNKYDKIKW
jgi:hypothetical protein